MPRYLTTVRRCEGRPFFCEHVLEQHFVQSPVCHQALQLGVRLVELLELPDLFGFQSRIPPLPPIEGLLGNPEMADQVGDGGPSSAYLSTATMCSTLKRLRYTASAFPSQREMMPEILLQHGPKKAGPTTISHFNINLRAWNSGNVFILAEP